MSDSTLFDINLHFLFHAQKRTSTSVPGGGLAFIFSQKMEDNNTMLTRPSSLQTTQTTRLFKKNPKLKPKSASTAVAVAAPTQRLSPTTAGSAIAGVDYPGLAFIDDEQHHEQRLSFCLGQAEACGENDEKASNDNNIETEPTTKAASIADSKPRIPRKDELFSFHKKAFKRDLNSPTKSLQLESASKVQVDNRRSSLSLLALSAAAQVRWKKIWTDGLFIRFC